MNWIEIFFSPMFAILDIPTVFLLLICAWYAWKVYKEVMAKEVLWLFSGWILISLLDIGFVVRDFLPSGTNQMQFSELVVALRFFPAFILAIGMKTLYDAAKRAFGRKK